MHLLNHLSVRNNINNLGFEELPLEMWELPKQNIENVDMKEHIKLFPMLTTIESLQW